VIYSIFEVFGLFALVEEPLTRINMNILLIPSLLNNIVAAQHLDPKILETKYLGRLGPSSLARNSGKLSENVEERACRIWEAKVTSNHRCKRSYQACSRWVLLLTAPSVFAV
jgi:hypothetical protein